MKNFLKTLGFSRLHVDMAASIPRFICCFALAFFYTFAIFSQTRSVSKEFLLGKQNYRNDTAFIKVPSRYTESRVYLKNETYGAFKRMHDAAQREGVTLTILSGTRSFSEQREKWESKWFSSDFSKIRDKKQRVTRMLRWWSMPGTSRHHWGTDIDLNSMKLKYYQTATGIAMYSWMSKNAHKFGFYQPFTANRTRGYQEEKWHWSYAPLSRKYIREYLVNVKYADIKGFPGSEFAAEIGVIENWVLQINPRCK